MSELQRRAELTEQPAPEARALSQTPDGPVEPRSSAHLDNLSRSHFWSAFTRVMAKR